MVRRLMFAVVFAVLVALLAIAPSWAQPHNRLDEIIARGTLRVGLTGDYRPFSTRDPATNQYTGIDIDMANALAGTLGVKLAIVPTSWRELLTDLNSGQFDIAMGGIAITMDRQRAALFSTPMMRVGKAAIARCVAKVRFPHFTAIDRAGVRVVVNPGGANERFARATLKSAQVTTVANNAQLLEELISGRADILIADVVEIRLLQLMNRELCAINPDKPFDFNELAYLLPRDVIWQQYVNQWLRIHIESGSYRTVADAYFR